MSGVAGLTVDLADPETRMFIKACYHVVTLLEGTNPQCEPPEIQSVHPGIKQYLDDLGKR